MWDIMSLSGCCLYAFLGQCETCIKTIQDIYYLLVRPLQHLEGIRKTPLCNPPGFAMQCSRTRAETCSWLSPADPDYRVEDLEVRVVFRASG